MLEEQRGAAARHLHDAVGDLAQLEVDTYRMRNAHEVARRVYGVNELLEGIERQ